ncbi:MAG: tetratricopeptide repeat protein [Myxococcaceae bacterium]
MPLQPTALLAIFGAVALAALLALLTALFSKGRSEEQARAYLAGFKYVLSDDPDAAIAELSKAAQLNTQTLETYFALGALFRRKGELDRAVRLHRNILLRQGLSPEVKQRARLELAVDYQRSGLRDQALETVNKHLAEQPDSKEALKLQRQILEEVGDFSGAVEAQAKLVRLEGKGERLLTHLLAELSRRDKEQGEALAQRAVELDPKSGDAHLALAEAWLARGRTLEVRSPLELALSLEPELAPKVAKLMHASHVPADELDVLLETRARSLPNPEPYELARALVHKLAGRPARAIELLRPIVEKHPRFWEARKELGALLLAQDRSEELRADYEQILGALGEPGMAFMCGECQQRLPEFVFRCPGCGAWDTVTRKEEPGPQRSRI